MTTVAVVGLGYVGLPLAVEFGKKHRTIGFDLSREKVASYRRHVDPTGEVTTEDLRGKKIHAGADGAEGSHHHRLFAPPSPRLRFSGLYPAAQHPCYEAERSCLRVPLEIT